ncbi:putative phage abortive infection protein [Virgibacillus chiguensis]|uniref:Putative phage abortive infection protein n=1 Tax=Virgibacillus chiguensis TaxID=411959 RepID=A0A1M5VIW3_9BACI|nr:putative phage abortive infection protein [Virgibacillus chiguensis]SHH75171.1 Putative phage abortive infection protein [Virgibacillus chiguensis]
MTKKNKNEKVPQGWFAAGIGAIFFALAIPFIIIYISKTDIKVKELGQLGPLGDFLGGSTIGLLSIASIFFIIHTILIQSKELSLQRKELSLTREELEKTREEHRTSNLNMKEQQFDNTFFNLVDNYHKTIKDISIRKNGEYYQGRSAINVMKKFLQKGLYDSYGSRDAMQKALNDSIDGLIKKFGYAFDHYFKTVYTVLNMVHISEFSIKTKLMYLKIFLSMISSDEKYLLYCMGFTTYGKETRELLLKYDSELRSFVEFDEIKEIYKLMENSSTSHLEDTE